MADRLAGGPPTTGDATTGDATIGGGLTGGEAASSGVSGLPATAAGPIGTAAARLPGPPAADGYREAMGLALAEARLALAAGDVPVGAAVVTAGGEVLGTGHNAREAAGDPTAHAEVIALRRAAARVGTWRLHDATLVVTLEPCTMCAGALVLARIDRLVYGAVDEKAGAVGSLWDVVRDRRLNHRPEVIAGVRGQECSDQLAAFFAGRRAARRAGHRVPRTPGEPDQHDVA